MNPIQIVVLSLVLPSIAGALAILISNSITQAYNARRSTPFAYVHHWWEPVIEPEQARLASPLLLGLRRPTPNVRPTQEAKVLQRSSWLVRNSEAEPAEKVQIAASTMAAWLVKPAFPIHRRSAGIVALWVLRVSVHNVSKRRLVRASEFGRLRFEIDFPSDYYLGWNRGFLGPRDDWRVGIVSAVPSPEITLTHDLDVGQVARDEFVFGLPASTHQSWTARDFPSVRVKVVENSITIRVKPWKPSPLRLRDAFSLFRRAYRRLRRSYRPVY